MGKLIVLLAIGALIYFWWTGGAARRRATMPLGEARSLLGVTPGDDAEAIRAAHRRIIARVHPDAGGTLELARCTNLARDVLLAELERGGNN